MIFFWRFSGFGKDPKRSKFEFYGRIQRLTILADYKLNGKVIILPVQGEGPANMTMGKSMKENILYHQISF